MRFPKRSIISKYKIFKLNKEHTILQDIHHKPTGLWYSYYGFWYRFILSSGLYSWLHKYIHSVTIKSGYLTDIYSKSQNKLLVIKNNKEFDIFHKRYKSKQVIDWKKVSKDYGGIEITNLVTRRNVDWYYAWDIPSGCIWNYELIKNINLVYIKDKDNNYKKI